MPFKIEELKRTPNSSYFRKQARRVFEKYVSSSSKQQVNLSCAVVQKIRAGLEEENIDRGVYNEAQADILKHLRNDAFPRFRTSKKFTDLQQQVVAEEDSERDPVVLFICKPESGS